MRRSESLATVLLVVALLGVAACSSSSKSQATPKPAETATSTAPSSAKPSAAAVDGTIVFRRFTDTTFTESQIVVGRIDGSHVLVLTNPGPKGVDQDPSWSSDGKRIAFTRILPETSCAIRTSCLLNEAFTVGATGGPATQLTHSPPGVICAVANIYSCDYAPDFSPDGKQLAFERQAATPAGTGSHHDIWVANADGSNARPITNPTFPIVDQNPVWSPDGKTIAFSRNTPTPKGETLTSEIFTVRVDGTGLRQITPSTVQLADPNWSPDGTKIIAVNPTEPTPFTPASIYTVRADGTGLTNLTGGNPDLQYTFGSYSPDGSYIIAARAEKGVHNGQAQLYLMTATGRALRVVDPDPNWQSKPRWQPAPS